MTKLINAPLKNVLICESLEIRKHGTTTGKGLNDPQLCRYVLPQKGLRILCHLPVRDPGDGIRIYFSSQIAIDE